MADSPLVERELVAERRYSFIAGYNRDGSPIIFTMGEREWKRIQRARARRRRREAPDGR